MTRVGGAPLVCPSPPTRSLSHWHGALSPGPIIESTKRDSDSASPSRIVHREPGRAPQNFGANLEKRSRGVEFLLKLAFSVTVKRRQALTARPSTGSIPLGLGTRLSLDRFIREDHWSKSQGTMRPALLLN